MSTISVMLVVHCKSPILTEKEWLVISLLTTKHFQCKCLFWRHLYRQKTAKLLTWFCKRALFLYTFPCSCISAICRQRSGGSTRCIMAAHSYRSSKHLGLELELITRTALLLALLTLTSHYWQERLCELVCSDESVTVIKIYSITFSLSHTCVQLSLWENQTKYIIQDWQRRSAVDAHCVCTRGSFVTELCVMCMCDLMLRVCLWEIYCQLSLFSEQNEC